MAAQSSNLSGDVSNANAGKCKKNTRFASSFLKQFPTLALSGLKKIMLKMSNALSLVECESPAELCCFGLIKKKK